ncbi:MAG: pentapeptide repeat-containing protein [Cellulosilyticaceae bacterium]
MTTTSKRVNDQINYKSKQKVGVDFSNKDLRRSNCYNCNFSEAIFNDTSFRGAQFKACKFNEARFDGAELVAANFKNSQFKAATFENVLFDSVNLENVDFEGATFKNVIFIATDLTKAINVTLEGEGVQQFEQMPTLEISEALEKAAASAMANEYIKYARVLDTKDGKVSPISMMLLLNQFDEETLIKGLKCLKNRVTKDFSTLKFIVETLKGYQAEGLI